VKLGIFVNDVATEKAEYTTTRLAMAAVNRGHEVWYVGAGDLAYDPDDVLRAQACRAANGLTDQEEFLKALEPERFTVEDLDALWLRSNPADDVPDRLWAQTTGIVFGGRAVIKPLQGSGGQRVFIVSQDDDVNLDQMVEAVTRDGYIVAQEQLPAAADGDVRLFLLDGQPLQSDGTYAAFRRVPGEGEARANMTAGATVEAAEVDDTMLRLAELVGSRLAEDGMFLAGLDIVGDQILEINVFSPGGFGSVEQLTGVDFNTIVVDALERKVSSTG
jgi:glutathione synthase